MYCYVKANIMDSNPYHLQTWPQELQVEEYRLNASSDTSDNTQETNSPPCRLG